jgi:endonuclease/exonuclease/phosphatase family metal-dependent hydrolase
MIVSILQWNIWCDEDIANIARFLAQNRSDIICLQEMTINYPKQKIKNAPEFIAKQIGYGSFYKELPIESTDGGKLMLANGIFSHFPIINSYYCWTNNPHKAGGYSNEKRVYVETELKVGNKRLTVGTTHMSYTHKFEINQQKAQETNNLISFVSKHKTNFIIAGDFNATPGSCTIEQFDKKYKNLGPDYDKNTWTTKPFSYNGFKESNLNWRLDYIFGTKDIKKVNSKVLKTEYSDHLPILTTINL